MGFIPGRNPGLQFANTFGLSANQKVAIEHTTAIETSG